MNLSIYSQLVDMIRVATPKIFSQYLKGLKVEEFKELLQSCFRQGGDAEEMWTTIANSIRRVAKKTLWVTSGKVNAHKVS